MTFGFTMYDPNNDLTPIDVKVVIYSRSRFDCIRSILNQLPQWSKLLRI